MKITTPPDLKVAGFSLWIHGREFPEADDYYTADWLIVSASLDTGSGRSWVSKSASLQSRELEEFINLAQAADWTVQEMVIEAPILEYGIRWAFIKDKRYPNQIILRVQVNANYMHETHIGWFKISFSDARAFLEQIRGVLLLYPNLQVKDTK